MDFLHHIEFKEPLGEEAEALIDQELRLRDQVTISLLAIPQRQLPFQNPSDPVLTIERSFRLRAWLDEEGRSHWIGVEYKGE